jgi:hypothetical protein
LRLPDPDLIFVLYITSSTSSLHQHVFFLRLRIAERVRVVTITSTPLRFPLRCRPYLFTATQPVDQASEAPKMAGILDLPPELLLRVSQDLTTPELGSLRRSCKIIEQALFKSFAKEFFTKRQFMIEVCFDAHIHHRQSGICH